MKIQVNTIHRLPNTNYLRAFADIIIDDALMIKCLRVIQGKNGLFVAMPQEQAADKKWYDRVKCMTDEVRDQITQVVLDAYSAEVPND